MKITLLVPTINEIEGMRAIMPKIKKDWVDEIIVVDDGSTDGTWEYAKEQGYITIRQKTPFLHGAYQDGLQVATGDVIITFSPDGNSVPELIPDLIRKMKEGYDMVIVSRYLNGAKSEDDDFLTGFGNWLFTKTINLCFGGSYTDTLVMFRAWKRDVVHLCGIANIGGSDPHMSIIAAKHKLKVSEIPGDEHKRIGGARKMRPFKNGFGILQLIVHELFAPLSPQAEEIKKKLHSENGFVPSRAH